MIATVMTVGLIGYDGALVSVETDMKQGLPGIHIVGMGSKAVFEARERVRSAIHHSFLDVPARKFTINLAPAELPKDGAHYDLPLALSLLVASGQLRPDEVAGAVFAGELSLDGSLRPIRGAIVITEAAHAHGYRTVYVPASQAAQAACIEGIDVIGVASLKDFYVHLKGERPIATTRYQPAAPDATGTSTAGYSFDDIAGHDQAKRALAIAVAGRHNILLQGSPGAGKTVLARAAAQLLPPPTIVEQQTMTKIASLASEVTDRLVTERPFRSPHHTVSLSAMIGGSGRPRPGEISLAHHGILFLDEIPEFSRPVLEALRQPLEDKTVTINRIHSTITYPADFVLIATMNPCSCGFYGDSSSRCRCSEEQIQRYQKRLSGPLLDRIDMVISVPRSDIHTIINNTTLHKKQRSPLLDLVKAARTSQQRRYKSSSIYNGNISTGQLKKLAIEPGANALLGQAASRLELSARSYFKVLRVAQTIADLDSASRISVAHMAEALQYRATSAD